MGRDEEAAGPAGNVPTSQYRISHLADGFSRGLLVGARRRTCADDLDGTLELRSRKILARGCLDGEAVTSSWTVRRLDPAGEPAAALGSAACAASVSRCD